MGFYKLEYTQEWLDSLLLKKNTYLLNKTLETISTFEIKSIEPATSQTPGVLILQKEDGTNNTIKTPKTIRFVYSYERPYKFKLIYEK